MSAATRALALVAAVVALGACSARQQQQTSNQAKDGLIAAGVSAKLSAIDLDAASNVHVGVTNGAVTLTGQAHSSAERSQYDAAAKSVDGVTTLTDKLTVNPLVRGAKESLDDAALAAKVAGTLGAQTGVNAFHVKPTVRGGVVTLTGTVGSAATKTTMIESVRKLAGVKRVIDNIEVK
ncbi:MAG: BON domain-containing protein [Candidatus Eremiobacteraeota bacterium]|nr:BON domain-containing protein [Candidatus Eremiobacteraeota bacterium]